MTATVTCPTCGHTDKGQILLVPAPFRGGSKYNGEYYDADTGRYVALAPSDACEDAIAGKIETHYTGLSGQSRRVYVQPQSHMLVVLFVRHDEIELVRFTAPEQRVRVPTNFGHPS